MRRYYQRWKQKLIDVDVRGAEKVARLVDDNCGVLITPNHASHADGFALYAVADEMGLPFYVMAAWQVLHYGGWLKRMIMRQHGAFGVDREGTDLLAVRQARDILETAPNPLVIFPEGEVYHINERVTPFREGPAAIALMAARKGDRPVYAVPCAMRYRYVEDPTPALLNLMDELEAAMYWRPRPDLSLPERVYDLAKAILALKEIEFCGKTCDGDMPSRIDHLIETILRPIEIRYGWEPNGRTVPERIKAVRKEAIANLAELSDEDSQRQQWYNDLDDAFLVMQAFSYPGDYVAENPTIERIAETLDKFEEDVLRETATVRGLRRAHVMLGEPILVHRKRSEMTVEQLTQQLAAEVQQLLQSI